MRLFAIPWTVAYQAPLSMEFSRQGYWGFPSAGDLPNLKIEPRSLALQEETLYPLSHQGSPRDPSSMATECGLTVSFEGWEDGVLKYLTMELIFKLSPER